MRASAGWATPGATVAAGRAGLLVSSSAIAPRPARWGETLMRPNTAAAQGPGGRAVVWLSLENRA